MDRAYDFETPPGAAGFPAELRAKLSAALQAKGGDYKPRTELLQPDGRARFVNRLILENSPYLLQHAHNPVNWYSWGDEAFETARREDRPIFLSIGYSTCHWCHVMELESFDNVEIARRMNERFVCIKVDREQRPDVDEIYMTAVMMTTGHGGWPMSSFLTPEGKPFFGATYFPPQRFSDLLERVGGLWKDQRPRLLADADQIGKALAEASAARGKAGAVGAEAVAKAVRQIVSQHDDRWGGFGGAPKFPHEPEILLLLETALRSGNSEALEAATNSLSAMARGGIYDQVGGGFARYSTDDRWLVPHFEKMLYNQAHLSRAYLESHRLTGNAFHARVARQTLDYVLRDMTSPQGAFYSATDADSEGEEGLFFLWSPAELRTALERDEAELAIDLYQVTDRGNFEGKNILYLPVPLDLYARKRQLDHEELLRRVDALREKLYQVREKRVHPLRDDKVLTAWNGMMITAFAAGFEVLEDRRYLDAAVRAAEFLWSKNRRAPGELWRVHLDGSSGIPATQEDHAYLAEALLALYDLTREQVWLDRTREVADAMLERFWDPTAGGFFMSASGVDPHLIARPKSPNDGATPSGNSVAVRALTRLGARTGDPKYRLKAGEALAAFASNIERYGAGHSYMLLGADELLHGEAGPRRYAAGGAVHVEARMQPEGRLEVELRLREGWHVNAEKTLSADLIPTQLELESGRGSWTLEKLDWPEPRQVTLGFQKEPLSVYEGQATIGAKLSWDPKSLEDAPVIAVRLRLQACDEQSCQLPETIVLHVPAAQALRR